MERYLEYREKLIKEICFIKDMFDRYKDLYNSSVDHVNALNFATGFFRMSITAFLECSILRLCKLFDRDPSVFSIRKFIGYIEQNRKIICPEKQIEIMKLVQKHILQLSDANALITNLKKLRNKSLAHNDLKYYRNGDIWKDANLTIGNYNSLIAMIYLIINDYSVLIENTTQLLGLGTDQEVGKLICAIEYYQKNS